MSPQHHIDSLNAPIIVTYGPSRHPIFNAKAENSPPAVNAVGKPGRLIEAPNYAHLEMAESLGNPCSPNGRAALAMMKLAPA